MRSFITRQAEAAMNDKKWGKLIVLSLKATIQRPETLIMRRWRRLWRAALGR